MTNNFIEIAKLIGKFQALETGLKIVLVMHEIAEDRKNDSVKDNYSLREVDELPFGILLKRYEKVSKNKELYDRLKVLKDYRNFLAHKSLLAVSSMPKELKEFIGARSEPLDYFSLNQELDDCIIEFSKQYLSGEL